MVLFGHRILNSGARALLSKAGASRLYSSRPSGPTPTTVFKRRFVRALAVGLGAGFAVSLYFNFKDKRTKVGAEAIPLPTSTVNLQPPTKAAPFPATISVNKEIFQALGTGVRTVTLLNFHVYAVGLYIAADDVKTARSVLSDFRPQLNPENGVKEWETLLSNPETGTEILSKLLSSNVRLAIRIVPVRNTDFGHMRDGFVRSVMNHPEFKKIQSVEVGESINEIKRAFGRKLKLKSGEVITWSRDINGGMSAWYGDTDENKELLGSVSHPDVARLFFLQYTSGSKPNSPTLKANALKGLVEILV